MQAITTSPEILGGASYQPWPAKPSSGMPFNLKIKNERRIYFNNKNKGE